MAEISEDLIWEIIRNNNAFMVKRKTGGGAQFSRDPFSLTNKHSRAHSGLVNHKAISVQAKEGGGASMVTKKDHKQHGQKPASHNQTASYKSGTPSRKIYRSIAQKTSQDDYRPELRRHAVARASAIHHSQQERKVAPEKKLRGSKAKNSMQGE